MAWAIGEAGDGGARVKMGFTVQKEILLGL